MFNFLDSFTSFCCSEVKAQTPAASAPAEAGVPENETESIFQEHSVNDAITKEVLVPVDPKDESSNYLVVHLTRPMGILFEENIDGKCGGAFIAEIMEGCSATADGSICRGDQLVAIGTKRVSGMDFDEIIKIVEESDSNIKLTIFRGPAESLYGPSGASVDWLEKFVAERGDEADSLDAVAAAEVFDAVSETVKAELFNDVAAAVLDAVGNIDKADEKLVDAEANVEEESTTEEKLVAVEDGVEVEGGIDSEDVPENAATEVEEAVVLDDDVATKDEGDECKVHSEIEANLTVRAVLVEDEVKKLDGKFEDEVGNIAKSDEKLVDAEANVEEESTTEEKLVAVEDGVEVEGGIDSEDVPENAATEVEEAVVLDDDVATKDEGDECKVHSEIEANLAVRAVLVEDEVKKLDGKFEDEVGNIAKSDELVDAEANVEEESTTEEKLVAVEDGVKVEEGIDSEDVPENAATEVEEAVVLDDDVTSEDERKVHSEAEANLAVGAVLVEDEVELDVKLECEADQKGSDVDENDALVIIENEVEADAEASVETDQEKGANSTNEALGVVENKVGIDGEIDSTTDLEKESDASEESLVVVENEVEAYNEISCELAQETAPTLNGIDTANEDLLDVHYANTSSEPVPTLLTSVSEKNA